MSERDDTLQPAPAQFTEGGTPDTSDRPKTGRDLREGSETPAFTESGTPDTNDKPKVDRSLAEELETTTEPVGQGVDKR
jgi:hypothetical protein